MPKTLMKANYLRQSLNKNNCLSADGQPLYNAIINAANEFCAVKLKAVPHFSGFNIKKIEGMEQI